MTSSLFNRVTAVVASLTIAVLLVAAGPYTTAFNRPRPYIERDVDQTARQLKSGSGIVNKITVTNHTTGWVFFKVWDATSAGLNTSTSTMLQDHGIPAGSGYTLEDVVYINGLTVKVTGAVGATDTTDPGANASHLHYWAKD